MMFMHELLCGKIILWQIFVLVFYSFYFYRLQYIYIVQSTINYKNKYILF